jgi:uroporphyrinogen decarboxylase
VDDELSTINTATRVLAMGKHLTRQLHHDTSRTGDTVLLPRERVIEVIEGRRPDRTPVYGWVRSNLSEQLNESFGSVEAFEDHYEFDFAHLFGGPSTYPSDALDELRSRGTIEPGDLLDIPMADVHDQGAYSGIIESLRHHKEARSRFTYVQTPGIFESNNGPFGIENHLMYLGMYEDALHEVYTRQADWNKAFAHNCLDLGVDMVHVSDDWGAQDALMFSPHTWWSLIYPYHKIICDAVKGRGAYLSLHTDGNVTQVMDGIIQLGYDVLHPYQESAGMDLGEYNEKYRGAITAMGGLDVQTTIGFGDYDRLRHQIQRVLGMFADGGLLYCTTHFVQDHCTIDELKFAYDLIYELVRRPGRE